MINWKKSQKSACDESIILNPKPESFAVPKENQLPVEKDPASNISEGEKSKTSEIMPDKKTKASRVKKADEVIDKSKNVDPAAEQFKADGENGKLDMAKDPKDPGVKQPGLSKEDASGKEYKDQGNVEKLDYPTKPAEMPKIDTAISEDKKIGEESKPAGESSDLKINPKDFKVPAGQPESDVKGTDYRHASKINWFVKKSEKSASFSKEAMILDNLLKFASECPECFDKLVIEASERIKTQKEAMLSPEENLELVSILDAADKGTLTSEQKSKLNELKPRIK